MHKYADQEFCAVARLCGQRAISKLYASITGGHARKKRAMAFCDKTIEILWGIRLNNYKSWYEEHKEDYKTYVREPMVALGKEVFDLIQAKEKSFDDFPKVSVVRRDTRFSRNKDPYKESIWVLFRNDQTPSIEHENPTFYFEVAPESFHLGCGYWPSPKRLAEFRLFCIANQARAEELFENIEKQGFYAISGEPYKRPKIDASHPLSKWLNCKSITLSRDFDIGGILYSPDLGKWVAEKFLEAYPFYDFTRNFA
jgi:uncharacterized protein (TIGR02453 family)